MQSFPNRIDQTVDLILGHHKSQRQLHGIPTPAHIETPALQTQLKWPAGASGTVLQTDTRCKSVVRMSSRMALPSADAQPVQSSLTSLSPAVGAVHARAHPVRQAPPRRQPVAEYVYPCGTRPYNRSALIHVGVVDFLLAQHGA